MKPKISHRCKSCGVAMRAGAQHCHQCGAALARTSESVAVSDDAPVVVNGKRSERGLNAVSPPSNPELSELPSSEKQAGGEQAPPVEEVASSVVVVQAVGASVGTHTKRQRVKDAAREIVADNVLPQVEKLRHASSVVLEEAAAIDPSIRFVMIAVFLFVVFLVLLLLSFIK